MNNKRRFITVVVAAVVVITLMLVLSAGVMARTFPSLTVGAGESLELRESSSVHKLVIEEGGTLGALEGRSLTMTIAGVETPIEPGTYYNVRLTVTDDIDVVKASPGPPGGQPEYYKFRTAIYVEDGVYVPSKSVAAAVVGGRVTDNGARDISIASVGPKFNGIVVQNSATSAKPFSYIVNNLNVNFRGNGGNDFSGYGSALMTDGYAALTINKSRFILDGVVRNAATIKGHSTLTINDSYIETSSPPLPAVTEGMMGVPWMLGLTGTCRSTNIIDYGSLNINRSYIKAAGWGALSTDATKTVRTNVKNSTIELTGSGYGAYSIGDSVTTFDRCNIKVKDMALIMANEVACGTFTNGSVVKSDRFGVMMHSDNVGTLTIDKGSAFDCGQTVIQAKSAYPEIVVDGAKLASGTGVILQAMVNDDPIAGAMPGAPLPRDINAGFSNTTLAGDIVNSNTTKANVNVFLKNATLTGAITTATVVSEASLRGVDFTKYPGFSAEGYAVAHLIGWVHNTYAPTNDPYGVTATVDADSTWIVDKTSYLTGLTIAKGATITAPAGYKVAMTVDGAWQAMRPGSYAGAIILKVTPLKVFGGTALGPRMLPATD